MIMASQGIVTLICLLGASWIPLAEGRLQDRFLVNDIYIYVKHHVLDLALHPTTSDQSSDPFNTRTMMFPSFHLLLLPLALFSSVCTAAPATTASTSVLSRAVSGYRNAAYFVNW
jgi:hypothetical protein